MTMPVMATMLMIKKMMILRTRRGWQRNDRNGADGHDDIDDALAVILTPLVCSSTS